MHPGIQFTQITKNRGQICSDILHALPAWFGIESATNQYIRDVENLPMLAAFSDHAAAGFVSLKLHNDFTAEIHLMAVHPSFHRKGIGRRLIEEVLDFLRAQNHKYLSVKTLSPRRPNREYDQTRQFYFAMGFRPVEEFKTLWERGTPAF